MRCPNFNPRSREGSDQVGIAFIPLWFKFQSTLPRRERRTGIRPQARTDDISIHAPAKGATGILLHDNIFFRFQSTLPRRERRNDFRSGSCVFIISIHAPAKGATQVFPGVPVVFDISIHAPAKGATSFHFRCVQRATISIHAPAKGATSIGISLLMTVYGFQSTLPRRERLSLAFISAASQYFNPRSREGSDIFI